MAITLNLPQDIEQQLREEWHDLERRTLEALVVEAYRQKKIGEHAVGVLLGFEDRWDTINFLSERGVYPNYDVEDFEEDMRNLAKPEGKR